MIKGRETYQMKAINEDYDYFLSNFGFFQNLNKFSKKIKISIFCIRFYQQGVIESKKHGVYHFFVKRTLVWLFRGHITHLWPQGTPSGTPNHNPYHQTIAFFLCPSYITKSLLARCHRVKKTSSLSFFCEKDPSLVLQGAIPHIYGHRGPPQAPQTTTCTTKLLRFSFVQAM